MCRLDESLTKNFTKQILEGLDYLHTNNVIHLDLKARNVLIDADNVLKLADFGLSMRLRDDICTSRQFNTCKGTYTHMAPEMIDTKFGKWGRKVDIWSLGVTCVEMLTGTHPWPETTDSFAFFFKLIKLTENEMPKFHLDDMESATSESLRDFLRQTFTIDYTKRPSAQQLLKHDFLNV